MNIRIISFLIFIIYKPINSGIVKVIDDSLLEYNNIDYISAYKIPNSIITSNQMDLQSLDKIYLLLLMIISKHIGHHQNIKKAHF